MSEYLANHPELVKQLTTPTAPASDWQSELIYSKPRSGPGHPLPVLANALVAFRRAPDWQGVLAFDEFSLQVVAKRPAPWQQSSDTIWTDRDDTLATEWLQQTGIVIASSKLTAEAVVAVAMEHPFHPVRDYFNGLVWDQQNRLDNWLSTYLGATSTPWTRAIGSRWLISSPARIFVPGCQVDNTLMVVSPQGYRKSSGLRILAGDQRFADNISDLGTKDSRIDLHGKQILEHAEMSHIRGAKLEAVKAFLTTRIDRFRPPYARRAIDVPRSCIFAATTNDSTPLTDETGNRRFWPVQCGRVDIDALQRDRDQLWAEAVAQYRAGKPWWLETDSLDELARDEQDERYDADVWEGLVLDWCRSPQQGNARDGDRLPLEPYESTPGRVTLADVLLHAIQKPIGQFHQVDQNRIAKILKHSGWERKQIRVGQSRKWFYLEPGGAM